MADLLGNHIGFTAFPDAGVYSRAAALGAKWLGSGEEWRWHLQGDGYTVDTTSLAAEFDATFDAGFHYVAGFLGAPPAVTGTSADGHFFPTTSLGLTRTTAAASAYAATLQARATAKGKQAIFKCYNELNQPQFDTAGASIATKADYVAAIMLGAKAGAPGLPIAGMSLAARGDINNPADALITAPGFAQALFDTRPDLYTNPALRPHYVAMHPYSYADGAANPQGWGGWVQLDALRVVLDEYGWTDVPILVTEVGHPSAPSGTNPIWTPERQATELDLIFRHLAYRTAVGQVAYPWLIFTEHDYDGGTGNDLGLNEADGTAKPAAAVFADWAARDLDLVGPPPQNDPPIGWGSVSDGWESSTGGWEEGGSLPPGPPYSPITDTAMTRRIPRRTGPAPTYQATAYT